MGARFTFRMRQTTSAEAFPALSPATLRQNIEASIERLLVMLDTLDADPDLEASLGWGAGGPLSFHNAVSPLVVDLEAEDEDEPSLGSLDRAEDQRQWCDGTRQELEEEADDEPDLGSSIMSSCIGAFALEPRRVGPYHYRDEFDFAGEWIDTRAPEDRV